MSSQQNIHMVAEPAVPIGKWFSGDVATYPKFKDRVKADSVRAGIDLIGKVDLQKSHIKSSLYQP